MRQSIQVEEFVPIFDLVFAANGTAPELIIGIDKNLVEIDRQVGQVARKQAER